MNKCQEAREIQIRAPEGPNRVYQAFSICSGHLPPEHSCCWGSETPLDGINFDARMIRESCAVPARLSSHTRRSSQAWA